MDDITVKLESMNDHDRMVVEAKALKSIQDTPEYEWLVEFNRLAAKLCRHTKAKHTSITVELSKTKVFERSDGSYPDSVFVSIDDFVAALRETCCQMYGSMTGDAVAKVLADMAAEQTGAA